MDRNEALRVIEALLDREGRSDVLAEVRRAMEVEATPHSDHPEGSARVLLESMPDGVIVHRDLAIVYASASALRMLGYPRGANIVGSPILDVLHPDDRASAAARVRLILEDFDVALPLSEQRLVRQDGSIVIVELSATGTIYDGKPAILSIARDITTRKKMEAQLVVNDRLASLGRLSASVGHELNNPLAYVLGNVGLLERELARPGALTPDARESLSSCVAIIKEGAERMRNIVHDLKMISRGDGDANVQVDVQQILDVCVHLSEHELRARARVFRDYREKVYVRGGGARIGQIFLNVLTNVVYAIAPGNAEGNEVRIVVDALDDDKALVEVSHTGDVIAPDEVGNIFEPFFIPRAGGPRELVGTGLSIAHRMVASAGGTITVEPVATGGLVFRIVLPAG